MWRIRLSWMPGVVLVGAIALLGQAACGEVTRITIETRESFAEGHAFARSGAYERIVGRMYIEVDPDDPANQRVTDLKLADRNENGHVGFWTDFFLLKPLDPTRGNRRLIFGVNNRGNKLMLGAFNNAGGNNPATLKDAGNGFLMREGYSILWCGWNGDVLPGGGRMVIDLPIVREDGQTITGTIHAEICTNSRAFSQPFYWGNSNPYPALSLDNSTATLTMRADRGQPAVEVPRERWAFARLENGQPVPDDKHLHLQDGFRPGWLYELVYTGKDPRVTGLGLVAVRDCVSFLRYAADHDQRPNPLAGAIEKSYAFGISQSGRLIHHFLYEGFNTDENERIVFDGAIPHVGGGGKGLFNYRFAQTTRHGSQHEDNLYPSDFFPFNSVPQTDPVTGQEGDAFARARSSGHMPKIFFTETSTEYWCRAGSLLHTDVEGKTDAAIDANVRLYFFTGAQHGVSGSPGRGIYQHERNTLDHRPLLRALLIALDRWVTTGEPPPPSRYPKISDGTLVDLATWQKSFPPIPAARLPAAFYTPVRLDFGPRWHSAGIADYIPPKTGAPFRTRVPAVDQDGNELAGIRLPDVSVPLMTLAGWNLRSAECGAENALARWSGSRWLFPRTAAERVQTGDPRLSAQERYATREAYLARVAQAALELKENGFLLDEDVVAIVRAAGRKRLWRQE